MNPSSLATKSSGFISLSRFIKIGDEVTAPPTGRGNPSTVEAFLEVPVWVFHGAADPLVSPTYSQEMVEALRVAGGTVKYTEYPEVEHSVWLYAYKEPELIEWLFAQKKEK